MANSENTFAGARTEEELLGILAGAASVCWKEAPTSVFDSYKASLFVEHALERLREIQTINGFFSMFFAKTVSFMGIGGHLNEIEFQKDASLRRKLLEEEYFEYLDGEMAGDPVEVADGLVDIIVIAFGTLCKYYGPDKAIRVLNEVADSNLSKFVPGENGKLAPVLREDGKILKGPGYFAPRIGKILDDEL